MKLGRAEPTIAPSPADEAYAAGFFDGEGNITIAVNRNVRGARGDIYNMRVGASQNNPAPLLWLRDRWGGTIHAMKRRTDTGNITHQWWIFARSAEKFLTAVRPYLIVKAERADIALAFQSEKYRTGVRGLSPDQRARMAYLRASLAALNTHKPTKV